MRAKNIRKFARSLCCLTPLLLLGNTVRANAACHPLYDLGSNNYMIGYGSLMNTKSKDRTSRHTGPNIPVLVRGFSRIWGLRGPTIGFGTTFLVVVPKPKANMNAVIFRLNGSLALANFDARERGYCRVQVPPKAIRMLGHNQQRPAGDFWIYVQRHPHVSPPTERYPIVQSYVDIFLTGCLKLQEHDGLRGFAKECVTRTKGWSKYWVDDRLEPRRPWVYQPYALRIDKLLSETIPAKFAARTIE